MMKNEIAPILKRLFKKLLLEILVEMRDNFLSKSDDKVIKNIADDINAEILNKAGDVNA